MHRGVIWVGTSRDDVKGFPEDARDEIGYALWVAETGGRHSSTKPLQGFSGAGVIEIIADDQDGTYRVVYTVKLADAIYVLHAFQKKSTKGSSVPERHKRLMLQRPWEAEMISAGRIEATREDH